MKINSQAFTLCALATFAVWSASCANQSQPSSTANSTRSAQQSGPLAAPTAAPQHAHGAGDAHDDTHSAAANNKRVPAHYANAASIGTLPATLNPEQFAGRVREGYQAARAIPKTLAQLPCYCYCDRGFGHKSLHSCFEDTHGANCGVCVEEALLAYKLEKEQKLSPAEIRAAVMKRFGPQ